MLVERLLIAGATPETIAGLGTTEALEVAIMNKRSERGQYSVEGGGLGETGGGNGSDDDDVDQYLRTAVEVEFLQSLETEECF